MALIGTSGAAAQEFDQNNVDPSQYQSQKIDLKQIFANSLAVAAAGTGSTLITGIMGALTGGISSWFAKRNKPPAADATVSTSVRVNPTEVAAGLAYEVHALRPEGGSDPIDPDRHTFRTGDRFMVLYRPTLPGKLEVYNINPSGEETHIETLDLAGGQLASMGPYEFTNTTGDERLKLIMHPCTTPALLTGTRDIIKSSGGDASVGAPSGGLALPTCGTATRSVGVRTRDIAKVQTEGSTTFALDRLTGEELASGRIDGREVTITFRHD